MEKDLLSIPKILIKNNGKDTLDNFTSTGYFVFKNTDSKYIPECEVLMICLTLGYHQKLIETSQSERVSVKKEIVNLLNNNEGFDLNLCNRTLDILEAAIFETEMPVKEEKMQSISFEEKLEITSAELNKEKELTKELESVIDEKDEQNKNLIKEINFLKSKNTENKKEVPVPDKALKKAKRKFNTILVLLIIVFFIIYSYINNKNSELLKQNELIYNELILLENKFEESKKIWAINVVDMKVGNVNRNNQWITRPGVELNADEVRYLNPVFTYNSPVTYSMTFFIMIIDPMGEIKRNNNSPAANTNSTYSRQYQVRRGQSLEFDPDGWGNVEGGIFYPGTWKIELWSEGFCLYSGNVDLK